MVFWEMLTLEVPFADMPPAQLIGGKCVFVGGCTCTSGPAGGVWGTLRDPPALAGQQGVSGLQAAPSSQPRSGRPSFPRAPDRALARAPLLALLQPWAWASCA